MEHLNRTTSGGVGDAPSSSCRAIIPRRSGGPSISSIGLLFVPLFVADSSHCVPDKQTGRAPHVSGASSPDMHARDTTSACACNPSSSLPNQRAPNG